MIFFSPSGYLVTFNLHTHTSEGVNQQKPRAQLNYYFALPSTHKHTSTHGKGSRRGIRQKEAGSVSNWQ